MNGLGHGGPADYADPAGPADPADPADRADHADPDAVDVQVLVVGSGPVGLVLAGLLGADGVSTLVVERRPTTSDEAKAISVDDESLRVLQRAGLDDVVYPILQPGTGTRYYGADGRLLVHARGGRPNLLGHPFKSSFAQPDFERVLLGAVSALPTVKVWMSTELTDLSQQADGVRGLLRRRDGTAVSVRAAYAVGCDGGRSTVRRLLGIGMRGRSFDDVWLVADTVRDPHRERFAMHHGEPMRPRVVVPGRDGRCRYEMKLEPHEHDEAATDPVALAARLIAPHRPLATTDIERCTAYRFHALVARRWREGRVFLAGDAAHMMPPFAGQGLNSGIRDVDNLSWKLRFVLDGRATPALLDTYEPERRPHAEAMIRLSVRLGSVVMTSGPRVARLRDATVRAANAVPAFRRYLAQARFKPVAAYRGATVFADPRVPELAGVPGVARRRRSPVGRMLPQPSVLFADGTTRLLDQALGRGFALVGVGCGPEAWAGAARSPLARLGLRLVDVALDDLVPVDREGRVGVADADGSLQDLFAPMRGTMLVVRPDRFVAATWHEASGSSGAGAELARFVAREAGASLIGAGDAVAAVAAGIPAGRSVPKATLPAYGRSTLEGAPGVAPAGPDADTVPGRRSP